MRIAILGTRGVPNFYGGFEQFAEYLSVGLVERGHDVTVYNSHTHPHQEKTFKGVKLVHRWDPEDKIGTAGQFIYDFNSILDSRKRSFDIILQAGYTSNTVWGWMLPRKSIITTNMDGLEWSRSKYSKIVQRFLRYAEKLGVKYSDYLISDSVGIQSYLLEKYNKDSIYIPYGSKLFENPDVAAFAHYDVKPYDYDMLVARLEPENSIEMILDGVAEAKTGRKFLIAGKNQTAYGKFLMEKFKDVPDIWFLGGVYDHHVLDNLRHYSNLYFHGHTVGGTNPSLLEAMGPGTLICANDNIFNASILGPDAFYFKTKSDIINVLRTAKKSDYMPFVENNIAKIENIYNWNIIVDQYEEHFKEIFEKRK